MAIARTHPMLNDVRESIIKIRKFYGNNFAILKLVGSFIRSVTVPANDIDVLIVFNENQRASAVLNCTQDWISSLRKKNDFFVISDSYFLPLIPLMYNSPVILHLILFLGLSHFRLSPYAKLLSVEDFDMHIESPSMQRLSWMLAAQDVLKFWCMHSLNELPTEQTNRFIELQNQSICKWLSPIEHIKDRFIKELVISIQSGGIL